MNMHVKQRDTMVACQHTLENSPGNCTRNSLYTCFLTSNNSRDKQFSPEKSTACNLLSINTTCLKYINLIRHDAWVIFILFNMYLSN